MIGGLIGFSLALSQVMVAGLAAALLLDHPESSRGRLAGMAFLLGSGIVMVVLLTMSTLGMPWSRLNVTVGMLLVTVPLWVAVRKMPARGVVHAQAWSWADTVTAAIVAMYGVLVALRPVGEWDFWAIWGLKGRTFFERGGIDWNFLREPLNSFQHSDYPPLVPLNYVFVAVQEGRWNDRWLGLTTLLFVAALLLIVRDVLTRELAPRSSGFASIALAAAATSPWVGMAETPLIAYGAAGLLLLRERSVPAGAVLLGLAASSKNEGLALIAAAGGALLVTGRIRDALRLWSAVMIAAPWVLLRAINGLRSDFGPGGFDITRLGQIVSTIGIAVPDRPLLWVALCLTLATLVRELRHERFLLVAVMLQLASYIGAYLVTPYDVAWHIRSSWPRLLDQVVVPLTFAALVLAAGALGHGRHDRERNGDEAGDDHERNDHGNRDGHHGGDGGDDGRHLHEEDDRQHRQEQQFER